MLFHSISFSTSARTRSLRLPMHDITGVAAYVIVGALLPHVLKLLYRLIARPSVYADDLDALALNVNPPETRWFNMGYWNAGWAPLSL